MKTKTRIIYVMTVMTLDNFFLKGLLMKMKSPIKTEVNMRIGSANMGYLVKTPMMTQYVNFLKYRITMSEIPNLFVFYIPR